MKSLEFKTAFSYPFNRPVGMTNILWVFVPIIGWFFLGGYSIRIIKEFVKGKHKELPKSNFNTDFKLGFFMFLKSIPFMIVYVILLGIIEKNESLLASLVNLFLAFFVLPMLSINFFVKETVGSFFELKILEPVFKNLWDYIIVMLKSIALGIIFFLMWIILIGIPAGAFTKNMFIADFYRRQIK